MTSVTSVFQSFSGLGCIARSLLHRAITLRAFRNAVAVFVFTTPLSAQQSLHWSDVHVVARLTEDGTLRVVETQTIVFTGPWNGGERRFDVRPRQRFTFERMRRIDSTGQARLMLEGDLSTVDNYAFVDGRTIRWRSRQVTDPPFDATPITYELTYSYSNVLVPDGENWILDHDFGFADRQGVIEDFSVQLTELEPHWQPTAMFNGRWQAKNLPPGEGFVVHVPLRYVGAGDGPEVTTPEPVERGLLIVILLVLLGSFVRRLYGHERGTGRLEPLASAASVDETWLEAHVFKHLPEVVGAAWDNKTGAAEVTAVIARLVSEGRMRSEVKGGGFLKSPELHLEMLVDRDRFHGHERRLVDALFAGSERTTSTSRIKERYKSSGFDPAEKIKKPLKDAVTGLVPGSNPSQPRSLPSFLMFLLAIAILVVAVTREPADLPVIFMVGFLTLACYFVAAAGATVFRNRVHAVGQAALFFIVPMAIALTALLVVVVTGFASASTVALVGLTALYIGLANSVFNQARSRESVERIAFRRRLATAREFFVDELRRTEPRLKDAWFPYLIAFGLGKHMDKWFRAFGGESSTHVVPGNYSSGGHGGSSTNSGGGWSGFGGGAGFSGGGSSASWAAAAGSMAAGVSAPSSSSGGSGGGGGGGGSSGGGGGGGW